MVVLDSSAAVDYLLRLEHGDWVADRLATEELHAPHVFDVEIAGALRRLVHRRAVGEERARRALADLLDLRLARYPHLPLLPRIWELRENVTPRDAAFVALAEALDAVLITTDRRLAGAPGVRASIVTP